MSEAMVTALRLPSNEICEEVSSLISAVEEAIHDMTRSPSSYEARALQRSSEQLLVKDKDVAFTDTWIYCTSASQALARVGLMQATC